MSWAASTLWWVAAGALVAAELATGTFYLLMIALGAAVGALAAHAGLPLTGQWLSASIVSAGATAAWHFKRKRQARSLPAATNPDVNIDIGQPVHVEVWASDGSARIHYRGAAWSVRYAGTGAPAPGEHVIVSVHGSQFGVAPGAPAVPR